MRTFSQKIVRFLLAEDGPTAVEYAMLILLVALGCLTAITLLGQSMTTSAGSPPTLPQVTDY